MGFGVITTALHNLLMVWYDSNITPGGLSCEKRLVIYCQSQGLEKPQCCDQHWCDGRILWRRGHLERHPEYFWIRSDSNDQPLTWVPDVSWTIKAKHTKTMKCPASKGGLYFAQFPQMTPKVYLAPKTYCRKRCFQNWLFFKVLACVRT